MKLGAAVIALCAVAFGASDLVLYRTHVPDVTGRLAQALGLDVSETEVSTGVFPFIPQLIAGSLRSVVLEADYLRAGGVGLTDLTVTAAGVDLSAPYVISNVRVSATISFEDLSDAIIRACDIRVVFSSSEGRLIARLPDGESVTTRTAILDGSLEFSFPTTDSGDGDNLTTCTRFSGSSLWSYQSATVDPDGVHVQMHGDHPALEEREAF